MQQLKNPDFLIDAINQAKEESTPERLKPEDRVDLKQSDHAPDTVDHIWQRLTVVEPSASTMRKNNLITESSDPQIAHFDRLRTRLLSTLGAKGLRRLAITSPQDGSGKSTIAANLALSLGRRGDLRIILFDLNLRRPTLIHLFGLDAVGPRFSALTYPRRGFESTAMRTGASLALSFAGVPTDAPSELIAAQKTAALFAQIEEEYQPDLMIFDTAALYPYDDALAALSLADCALIVAHADSDTLDRLDRCERLVSEHCTNLGVILNQSRFD